MGWLKAIGEVFGFVNRIWSWFFSPQKEAQRRKAEADEIIETHDETKINRMLDDKLP